MKPSCRVSVCLLVLFGALAGPVTVAGAKGVSSVAVCGGDGCTDLTYRASSFDTSFPMGKVVAPPHVSAPFVRVVSTISAPAGETGREKPIAHSSYLYVPSLQLARTQRRTQGATGAQMRAVWQHLAPMQVRGLERLLDGVIRYPARRLDTIVHSPAVKLPPVPKDRGQIVTEPSTIGMTVRYPPPAAADNGGTSWEWWGIAGGAVIVIAAAGVAVRRRRWGTGSNAARAT